MVAVPRGGSTPASHVPAQLLAVLARLGSSGPSPVPLPYSRQSPPSQYAVGEGVPLGISQTSPISPKIMSTVLSLHWPWG